MYISQQLKQQNIAEYLLYMWQVEDLIRANGFDIERIKKNIVEPYPSLSEEQKKALIQWYADLINMMHDEGVMEKGHIQINKNIIVWLTDLHLRLLASPKFPYYSAAIIKPCLLLWNYAQKEPIKMCLNLKLVLMPCMVS